jgi:hypothetical protein
MTLTDYLIEQCQHDLSLLKGELTNFAYVDMVDKITDMMQDMKANRKREQEITGVRK